ncbi:MAG: ATP-binding protein [Propionibacteriales bacterium]|nr:ATP-binding protein [Propionibacteriales bacterium]
MGVVGAVRRSEAATSVRLPFSPASVRTIRDRLTTDLEARELPAESVDDARIVLSELVANALRHARPLPEDTLCASWHVRENGMVVSVTDGGSSTAPHVQRTSELSDGGRGLAIVDVLAHRWWMESDASQSSVFAEIAWH